MVLDMNFGKNCDTKYADLNIYKLAILFELYDKCFFSIGKL